MIPASVARADGDPGSDVLVYQPLFLGADSGVSICQQSQLGGLLRSAARQGFPVRVAIISSRNDLGAVTGLWRQPRNYARFLGLELSLSYKGRLLVVMPNGIGFNWPGHASADAYRTLEKVSIKLGGSGLATAAQTAVQSLATDAGVKLTAPTAASGAGGESASAGSGTEATASSGNSDNVLIFLGVVVALVAAGVGIRYAVRRRRGGVAAGGPTPARKAIPRRSLRVGIPVAAFLVDRGRRPDRGVRRARIAEDHCSSTPWRATPTLTPARSCAAGRPTSRSLTSSASRSRCSSFRGKVVVLAFNDSECTTICPLTTSAMVQAKAMLGAAGRQVAAARRRRQPEGDLAGGRAAPTPRSTGCCTSGGS